MMQREPSCRPDGWSKRGTTGFVRINWLPYRTPADLLPAGMRLATLGGEWVGVEECYDTGEYETVYNCRVAEYHTSFVGDDTHVLAVWAHNAYDAVQRSKFKEAAVKLISALPQPLRGERRITNSEMWVKDKWNTVGSLHSDPARKERFALSVATSLRLAGATEPQIRGLLEVICGFPEQHIAKGLQNAFRERLAREAAVGKTPDRDSTVGEAVFNRMTQEPNPDYDPVRDVGHQNMMAYVDTEGQKWVFSKRPASKNPDVLATGYYEFERCVMGHHPVDAVVFWNDGDPRYENKTPGKKFPRDIGGKPGPKVWAWMNDPKNYQLQFSGHNSSAGGGLWSRGYFWVSPEPS
ncbi:MAG: hypothetical protein SNJ75_01260 [Gemmataceae bacterium]